MPSGVAVHRLSDVDTVNRLGVCAVCGPVGLKSAGNSWRCRRAWNDNNRQHKARYRRKRRSPYLEHRGPACERCGFVPEHFSQLDVDHINRDHADNRPENLQTLCANCHRLKTHQERLDSGIVTA